MRLEKIKLVGFKSFVDPTDVIFPSNLCAVLGPNGCGKSNTIDAVRWVMGESSAKNLRGSSMSDVIFNGSEHRKPVGQASVELVFDNSEGKIGGEYAKYSQIAIRRSVTRDGQSHYFLNNTKCRRKDITGIFLGTGLGPRSYSIIGQGTISKLIEAKPEEFRMFLEEAAGISKYKERRRETENRIKHTRENLDRLNDFRDELGKQLERLHRQANAAERFQVLKTQERLSKAQLLALRWQTINEQLEQHQSIIREQEVALEAIIAKQRSIDTEIEKFRDGHVEATDTFNEAQASYYQLAAEIARIEEALTHSRERREQLNADLDETQDALAQIEQQHEEDATQITQLQSILEENMPLYEERQAQTSEIQQQLTQAEIAHTEWQGQWDDFNSQAADSAKQAHVEQTRIQHIENAFKSIQQRIERLTEEKSNFNVLELETETSELRDQAGVFEEQHEEAHQSLSNAIDDIAHLRNKIREYRDDLNRSQQQFQTMRGRHASLEALQQAALGQKDDHLSQWLCEHNINDKPRLAQSIQVDTGWELAVETVLGDYLQAVCVDDLSSMADAISSLQHGKLSLIDTNIQSSVMHQPSLTSLVSKVKTDISSVDALMADIYVADDLLSAYEMLGQLKSQQSIITKEGIWLGPGWLRFAKEEDATAGLLQREQELKQLTADIEKQQQTVDDLEQLFESSQEELQGLEDRREQSQAELNEVNQQLADVNARIRVKQGRLEQMLQRMEEIAQQISDERATNESKQEELTQAREAWQHAMQAMEQDSEMRDSLQTTRETINQQLDNARQSLHQHQGTVHQLQLVISSNETQLANLSQNKQRLVSTLDNLRNKQRSLQSALSESSSPAADMASQLEQKLEKHVALEEQVQQARSRLETIDSTMRDLNEKRHGEEEHHYQQQSTLEQSRMSVQGDKVRQTTLQEQLAETEYTLAQLLEAMPEHAAVESWEDELARIAQRIQRLGAINLAAIDEFKTESERKEYLDSQNDDLMEALNILESAIERIDNETRERFKDTFDRVNTSFQHLFPKLFGGGKAMLEMTGDDLLDTGITVMAQPPGKRNSSIHLLSGGEKALSAVALVFAIFQLNPSPFCMLDEVDAPLDDANVTRFCNLVKEMSKTVQFIFITHNKVTMEMADYLSGVTMNEPGVSRVVSVNVDEAISLAEG